MEDPNLYAYVFNDPTDRTDPTGLAHVCTDTTGSRIPSCVDVDANGDGNTKDDDLTKSQTEALGRDFHSFIVNHNGEDLSKNGLDVHNVGASEENANLYRAVSQFVGTARGGWKDGTWSLTVGTKSALAASGWEGNVSAELAAWSYSLSGGVAGRNIFAGTDMPGMLRPSNVSRAILHETLHTSTVWEMLMDPFGGHQRLDSKARQLNMDYGFGKCDAMGGFPACQ